MSLLETNRHPRDVKPKKMAKIDDLDKSINKNNASVKKGHKTTLTIDSQTKNKLQAMVLMGDAKNQKDGMAIAVQTYYDNLPSDKKSMFDILYNSLEKRDDK